jgi:hypothetical protein
MFKSAAAGAPKNLKIALIFVAVLKRRPPAKTTFRCSNIGINERDQNQRGPSARGAEQVAQADKVDRRE